MALDRRGILGLAAAAVASRLDSLQARADDPSSVPVRIIVGFPSGGPLDIGAHVIAGVLGERLGRSFVVENQPGTNGNRSTKTVARAPPDGDTLLLCAPVNAINVTLLPDSDLDFVHDIVPVAGAFRVPLIVEASPSTAIKDVPDFLSLARSRAGQLKVAYAGKGTPQHVGIALFKAMTGLDFTLVSYPGSKAALDDLLVGRADVMFDPSPSSMDLVKSGRLVPLAVTGATPLAALPGVPPMAKFVPGFEAGSWFGLGAPKGTSEALVGELNQALNGGLAEPSVVARIVALGGTPMAGTPETFAAFIQSEIDRYRTIIRQLGLTMP